MINLEIFQLSLSVCFKFSRFMPSLSGNSNDSTIYPSVPLKCSVTILVSVKVSDRYIAFFFKSFTVIDELATNPAFSYLFAKLIKYRSLLPGLAIIKRI